MKAQARKPVDATRPETELDGLIRAGKDEMNLAEFPISLLTNHIPDDQTMVEFKDRYFDEATGKTITRRLTITAAPEAVKHLDKVIDANGKTEWVENPDKTRFRSGLPRAVDDDVLLGLIQLTKLQNNFTSPEVRFSRLGLIRLLGWPDSGVSYKRLDESLHRWVSVTLKYENAWRDNRGKRWISDSFHILDNVQLNDTRTNNDQGELFPSLFRWNVRVFESFQSGYLKSIDYRLYLSLRNQTSKRMYRFLSKRMYFKADIEFVLGDFAVGHVGLSSGYSSNAGKLKEKLQPGLDELEAVGFLEPAERDQRYWKEGKTWHIRLKRRDASPALDSPAAAEPASPVIEPPLVAHLIGQGVTRSTAAELVKSFDAARIQAQLDHLAWVQDAKPSKISDPAAWLVSAIKADHAAPKGFISPAQRQQLAEAKAAKEREDSEARRRRQAEAAHERAAKAKIAAYRKSLNAEQLAQLEAEVIAAASDELRRNLDDPAMKLFRGTLIIQATNEHIARLVEPA